VQRNTPRDDQPVVTAILVGVDFGHGSFDSELSELGLLAQTAGIEPVGRITCKRKSPDAALFVGSGKADEIKQLALQLGATEVLFDQSLSPAQQRNLERALELPVNDRVMLILQIFAQRARSHEGKLQVELARLQYLSTRLVRRWSHLERQSGGIGLRGGPGERQIELDKRMINESIKKIKDRLVKVKKQRNTQRRQRERRDTFNISIVGYTNAGKSTLFNTLVKAQAYAADQLFATLDTTTRQMYLAQIQSSVSLSDTVGFVRDLPHGLVAAFQATLQEAVNADLLLHVVDASNPDWPAQIEQVNDVLTEIGANEIPQFLVFNKLDAIAEDKKPDQLQGFYDRDGQLLHKIYVSAQQNIGLDVLRQAISDFIQSEKAEIENQDLKNNYNSHKTLELDTELIQDIDNSD
jgi:GTP-binding protein HflX